MIINVFLSRIKWQQRKRNVKPLKNEMKKTTYVSRVTFLHVSFYWRRSWIWYDRFEIGWISLFWSWHFDVWPLIDKIRSYRFFSSYSFLVFRHHRSDNTFRNVFRWFNITQSKKKFIIDWFGMWRFLSVVLFVWFVVFVFWLILVCAYPSKSPDHLK